MFIKIVNNFEYEMCFLRVRLTLSCVFILNIVSNDHMESIVMLLLRFSAEITAPLTDRHAHSYWTGLLSFQESTAQ
jgi:hypothetical protein